jgi:SAM-dependent methyltransferase
MVGHDAMMPFSAVDLYDAFAPDYDAAFDAPSLRRAYDALAWERVASLLPAAPSVVIDAGCGTGRAAARCLAAGHKVIGIEPSPAMRAVSAAKCASPAFDLLASGIEDAELPPACADAVLALGCVQYAADPPAALLRMASWLRPGGVLCLHVDGLAALALELIRLGRPEEALRRLADRWGVFAHAGRRARLHLFDGAGAAALLSGAGLADVQTRGLLVSPAAMGRQAAEAAVARDEAAFMALERALADAPAMTDAGKHVIAWGRRPL